LYVIICKRDDGGGKKVNEINEFQEPGMGSGVWLFEFGPIS
jgi:hypothetical protein